MVELLTLAETLSATPGPDQRLSSQETLLRSIMVLIVGALHGFLLGLLTEWADSLDASWNNLSALQKRYVAHQVLRRLDELLKDLGEADLSEDKKQLSFLDNVKQAAEWYSNPSALASAKDRYELREFFRDHGGKAIDKALASFSDDRMLFFDWLSSRDARYADYRDRLNNAIAIRNEAAHGIVGRRITLRDVRIYRVTIVRIVQRADEFVRRSRPAPPIQAMAQPV